MSFLSSISPSMAYLIAKMLVFLVLAFLVGLLVGWLMGKLGRQRRISEVESNWRQTLADTEDDHRRVVHRFKKHNQGLDDENNTLKTKISTLNSRIDSNRDELERLKLDAEEHQAKLEQVGNSQHDLDSRLAEEQGKNQKLQTLIKALKSATDDKDAKIRRAKSDLEAAQQAAQVGSVENNEGYQALQRENAELRGAIRENADLYQRVAVESREKEEALAELHATRERLIKTGIERDEYRTWTTKLEQEKAGHDDRVQHAVSEALQNSGSSTSELEIEVARLRPMVKTMNTQITQLRDENRSLSDKIASRSHTSTPVIDNSHLHASLRDVAYERDQLKVRSADFERQIVDLNSQLQGQSAQQDLLALRRQVAELSAEKGLMSAQIEELKNSYG